MVTRTEPSKDLQTVNPSKGVVFFLSAKNGIKIRGDTKGYLNPFT